MLVIIWEVIYLSRINELCLLCSWTNGCILFCTTVITAPLGIFLRYTVLIVKLWSVCIQTDISQYAMVWHGAIYIVNPVFMLWLLILMTTIARGSRIEDRFVFRRRECIARQIVSNQPHRVDIHGKCDVNASDLNVRKAREGSYYIWLVSPHAMRMDARFGHHGVDCFMPFSLT